MPGVWAIIQGMMSSSLPFMEPLSPEQRQAFTEAVQQGLIAVPSPFLPKGPKALLGFWQAVAMDQACPKRSIHHWPDEFVAYVPAHMQVSQVQQLLAETGQQLPYDYPETWTVAQILAYAPLAENEPWHMSFRQGLLGLHWLDATGTCIGAGGRVMKNVTGYDLHRFHFGMHGALGLPIGVCLRTTPLPIHPLQRMSMPATSQQAIEVFHRFRQKPPEALQGLWMARSRLCLHWQGSEESLARTLQQVGLDAACMVPVPIDSHAAMYHVEVRGLAREVVLNAWNALQKLLPEAKIIFNLGTGVLEMRWPVDCIKAMADPLSLLLSWLEKAVATSSLTAVNILPWHVPDDHAAWARDQWALQLSPTLWQQLLRMRRVWGIEPHMFASAYGPFTPLQQNEKAVIHA
jgi:hypothetical protein